MACGTTNLNWGRRCIERLNEAIERSTKEMAGFGLYGGLCGLGWTVEHVLRMLDEHLGADESGESPIFGRASFRDPNGEIDSALIRRLSSPVKRGLFDLIYGLVGWGVYLLERWPDGSSIEGLQLVIAALEKIAEDVGPGTTWLSAPEVMTTEQRERYPNGYYNLGIAHGVPGVLQFLLRTEKRGIEAPRASRLLERALVWLVAQVDPNRGGARFGSRVSPDGSWEGSRPVWCYGDLGVGAILLQVGKRNACRDVGAFAREVLERCLELPVDSYRVEDAGLCHGAIGIAHIYNRIYQATGDERFRDAALDWYKRTLAMFKPGTGVGGYSKCMSTEDGSLVWEPWPAFLDGSIGIALGLLAAVTTIEPQWDRALLLSDSEPVTRQTQEDGESAYSIV